MTARKGWERLIGYGVAVMVTAVGTAVIVALDHVVHIPNASLLYLPAILFTAVYFGTWPSLLAATLAVLEYDFFLLRPIFTFTIAQVADILAFIIFVIVAILTSQLAARARDRAETAQRRATESTMLYELGQALMSAQDVPDILQAITGRIVDVFGVDTCAIFVPGPDDGLVLAAETPSGVERDRGSGATTAWVFRQGSRVWLPAGDSGPLHDQRVYVPLKTADRIVGVMEVGRKRGESLDEDERRLITSFAAQAALVITRAQTDEDRHRLQVAEESDRLKTALINAVSHDLRTPLASIKASATALLLADARWTREEGREFLQAIDHEADRLNRLVGNLLDLSRIEAGVLRPVLDWYHMQEVIDTVVPHIRPLLAGRLFSVDLQPDLPPVSLDLLRVEELIINLVENAIKYSPPHSAIELTVRHGPDGVAIAVIDHGAGVPPESRKQIFGTFERGHGHGDHAPGTGLGLAICRGIARAHGGSLSVEDTPGGGATFVFLLPASHVGEGVPV